MRTNDQQISYERLRNGRLLKVHIVLIALKIFFIDNGFNMQHVLKVKVKRYSLFCNAKNIVYHAILLYGYKTGRKNIIGQYYFS